MRYVQDHAFTVSEVNEYARMVLSGDPLLKDLTVTGEITGYKHHYSGHRYFALKDAQSRLSCVMFRQDAMRLDFEPQDGLKVVVRGHATLYVRDGSYQLYVESMQKSGRGDLYEQMERTKAKLAAEGLFDAARKRPIPMLPRRIGVVTSRTGAVIHDIIRVARRRDPNVGILLCPCAVQGASAAPSIVRAIEELNRRSDCDVLLVGRGGGSIEDLWAYNEESVARAIAASRIPVISCIGHEVDTTIADYAADMRAPTPSAAAELAVPLLGELVASIDSCTMRLASALARGQRERRQRFEHVVTRPGLTAPFDVMINPRMTKLSMATRSLEAAFTKGYGTKKQALGLLSGKLEALDPDGVLRRGYAYVRYRDGILADAKKAAVGEKIDVILRDGSLRAQVLSIGGKDDA
ncbi:MAG: exodeoxyribonuclease VII large subunit [Clostridiales bacterium]|nr:exodeoxyribonuclease VII large subunit [Clostridiales bacterium]